MEIARVTRKVLQYISRSERKKLNQMSYVKLLRVRKEVEINRYKWHT